MNLEQSESIFIKVIGVNYRRSSTKDRELTKDFFNNSYSILENKSKETESEFIYIETCNRFEILFVSNNLSFYNKIIELFSSLNSLAQNSIESYEHTNMFAIKHLFSLAVGLDSMVLGEPQILGQLKVLYRNLSIDKNLRLGVLGPCIHRLFQEAFRVAKIIRTSTGIGRGTNSVAYAGIQQSKVVFGDLSKLNALVIGAGETGELAIKILKNEKISSLFIANRTLDKALILAKKYGGSVLALTEVNSILKLIDIIFIAVDGGKFKLFTKDIKEAIKLREYNIQCYIDVSSPGVLPDDINKIEGAFNFDLDKLSQIVSLNALNREKEAVRALEIIADESKTISNWLNSRSSLKILSEVKDEVIKINNLNSPSKHIYKRKFLKALDCFFKTVRLNGSLSLTRSELIDQLSDL